MAIVKTSEWKKVFGNVLNRGSTLTDEEERLGLPPGTLKTQGDKKWRTDPKWARVLRESERNEKAQNRKKGRNPAPTVSAPAPTPTPTASAPAPTTPAPTTPTEKPEALPPTLVRKPSVEAESDKPEPLPPTLAKKHEPLPPTLAKPKNSEPTEAPTATTTQLTQPTLEELEAKKASLRAELETMSDQLAKARQIVLIRTETEQQAAEAAGKARVAFEEANRLMREAEDTWRQAKAEADKAKAEVAELEAEQAKSEADLKVLASEIETVKEKMNKMIYMVDPWYTGDLPEFGTFISSEPMEGVEVVEVPKDYTVELVTQSILLFSDTRDVIRAKAFTELIWMYGDRGIQYTLLTEEGSVMNEFLKMYF